MPSSENNRRDFLKIASAAVVGGSIASTTRADDEKTPRILNHCPKMKYRRLGKTEFMISEIAELSITTFWTFPRELSTALPTSFGETDTDG